MAQTTGKADIAVRRLLLRHAEDIMQGHVWISEHDRWLELVFALFCATCPNPQITLRALTSELDSLGLLRIGEINETDHWLELCLDVTAHRNLLNDDAKRALAAVKEAAAALSRDYGSKIQKLLRDHGQRLLAAIAKDLRLVSLKKNEVDFALTYWGQNVLSLPISLNDQVLKTFAKDVETSPDRSEQWPTLDRTKTPNARQ